MLKMPSRRSRGRIANPPRHQLEREESRLARFKGILKIDLQGNCPPKAKNRQSRLLERAQSSSPFNSFLILHRRLSYMGDLTDKGARVRGILIAREFPSRAVSAARVTPSLRLVRYGFRFTFETATGSSSRISTTLADLLRPPLVANPREAEKLARAPHPQAPHRAAMPLYWLLLPP